MAAILTLITLIASVNCQFRAFPLYLPQHLHRTHYDPCKPLTSHCPFVMHGGHYGPRSYGNPRRIPPYTTYLENIEHAFYLVKHHITAYKGPDKTFYKEEKLRASLSLQPLTQYVTILSAVRNLIDQVALNGEEFYPQFYLVTVLKTLKEVSNNPVQATGRLLTHMDHFLEQISQVKALIKNKQETKCEDPNSTECDMIIHFAIEQSSDQMLSRQADLLAAGGNEVIIFIKMATLIENTANYRLAEDFLSNGAELLEPLVIAGFETMKVLEAIASLSLPPTHLNVYKNKFSVEEMLNHLVSLRSDEEKKVKAAQQTDNPIYDEKADAQLVGSEKLGFAVQTDDYDDYLSNSGEIQDQLDEIIKKQDHVVQLIKQQEHVVEPAENQNNVFPLAKIEDHVTKTARNQDHVVKRAEKQDNFVQLAEEQGNVIQLPMKLDPVVETTENSEKLKLTEDRVHLNEPTHIITQQEPKISLKYFKPKIIINYN